MICTERRGAHVDDVVVVAFRGRIVTVRVRQHRQVIQVDRDGRVIFIEKHLKYVDVLRPFFEIPELVLKTDEALEAYATYLGKPTQKAKLLFLAGEDGAPLVGQVGPTGRIAAFRRIFRIGLRPGDERSLRFAALIDRLLVEWGYRTSFINPINDKAETEQLTEEFQAAQ